MFVGFFKGFVRTLQEQLGASPRIYKTFQYATIRFLLNRKALAKTTLTGYSDD